MTDPVAPTSTQTPAPVARTTPVEPTSSLAGAGAAPDPEPKRRPLTVDVARSDNGVFVYTLRDPATDTVIAVIPRDDVVLDRDGRNFDQRV